MRAGYIKPMKQKLEEKIEAITESGCWIWLGATDKDGYGCIGGSSYGVPLPMTKAHRASYALYVAPIPEGMHVLHTCDVSACINPAHLYLGTPRENGRDKVLRKRGRTGDQRGEKNGMYGRCGVHNPFFGRHHTQESIAQANAGRKLKREARAELMALIRG